MTTYTLRCLLIAAAPLLLLPAGASLAQPANNAPTPAASRVWDFQVLLDGKPIGEHRFEVTRQGDERRVSSRASFTVKLLGVPVYRYQHEADETWRGDCLTGLTSTTRDGGDRQALRAALSTDGKTLRIEPSGPGSAPASSASGCLMSYAYWNPAALASQARLLNSQTGAVDAVRVRRIERADAETGVRDDGPGPAAARLRIDNPAGPVDVWLTPQGDWVGLDASVSGGRKLSYRLKNG